MTEPALLVQKGLLQNCLSWFQVDFRQSIVSLVETEFPNYLLPREVQSVLECWEELRQLVEATTTLSPTTTATTAPAMCLDSSCTLTAPSKKASRSAGSVT